MHTLAAATLTDAKRERDSWLAGMREGRTAARNASTLADLFVEHQNARDLSDRTRQHEQHLLDRHLAALKSRRIQDITTSEVAKLLRSLRDRDYSPWT